MIDWRKTGIVGCWLLFLWGQPLNSFAQLVLDEDFGADGSLFLEADTVTSVVHGLRLDGDSMIVLSQVGPVSATETDRDVLVTKLGPQGELDLDFGQGGSLRFDFDTLAYSTGIYLFQDVDGSFLVLGSGKSDANSTRTLGCIQRISASGGLLPVSPSEFTLQYEVMGLEEYTNVLQLDAAGRYLVGGSTWDPVGNHPQPVVLRYTADWALDTSFGGTGKVLFDFGGTIGVRAGAVHFSGGFIRDLLARPDSGMAICGALSNGSHYEGFVAAIAADGSLETNFCPPLGYAFFDVFDGYDTRLQRLASLSDGTLVFAGSAHPGHPDPDILLGRLNPANGSSVFEKIDLDNSDDEFEDLVLREDGSLVAFATRKGSGERTMALIEVPDPVRLENHSVSHFSPDSTFEIGGNFLLAQSDRVVMGGFQRTAGPRIRGLLMAARSPATFSPLAVEAAPHISIFPHPAQSFFSVHCSERIQKLSLYSLQGQLCHRESVGWSHEAQVQLPPLPAGTYLLTVNQQWRRKIVLR